MEKDKRVWSGYVFFAFAATAALAGPGGWNHGMGCKGHGGKFRGRYKSRLIQDKNKS